MTVPKVHSQRWSRLMSLLQTGSLYLVPRVFPLGLIAIIGLRSGLDGIGRVALAMTVFQFLLIACDFGASQWALTRTRYGRPELVEAIRGRLTASLLAAAVVAIFALTVVSDELRTSLLVVAVGIVFSLGQFSFAWSLSTGETRRAATAAGLEYVLPLAVCAFFENPIVTLSVAIATKSTAGLLLTLDAIRSCEEGSQAGLAAGKFGWNSVLLSLSSVGSGMGEVMALQSAIVSSTLGTFRVMQSTASVGSSVGFALLAPLIRSDAGAGKWKRQSLLVALLSAAALALPAYLFLRHSLPLATVPAWWPVVTIGCLFGAAVLASASVPPLAVVTRKFGTKYAVRVALLSASTYWAIILWVTLSDSRLLTPLAPLCASLVGLVGNYVTAARYLDGA